MTDGAFFRGTLLGLCNRCFCIYGTFGHFGNRALAFTQDQKKYDGLLLTDLGPEALEFLVLMRTKSCPPAKLKSYN